MKERLHDTLEERGRSCKILVVCGLGGAGKSQLMLNYIEVFRDDYTAAFWIDAGSKERLDSDYKQIHNLLLRTKKDDIDIDTCVSEIRQWCQYREGRYMFVLDSADNIEDVESREYIDLHRYIVDAASVDFVITTRMQSAKDMTVLEAVQVAELAPEESRGIFLRRMKLQDPDPSVQEEIDAITDELGHFALAVSLAAAYVANTRRLRAHPAGYLVEYAERKKELLARRPKQHIDQYGDSVLTTWETSYAAISDRYPEACNMLALMAFLNSGDLFPELLGSDYETASGILASVILVQESTMSLQESLDHGFETLELYSFLQWSSQAQSFSMHKLVHTWSLERLRAVEHATFCYAVWSYLDHLFSISRRIPTMSERLVSHTLSCFVRVQAWCQGEGRSSKLFASSANSLLYYIISTGRYEFACELQSFKHEYYAQQRFFAPMAYLKSLFELSIFLEYNRKYDAAEVQLRLLFDALGTTEGPLSEECLTIRDSCQNVFARILAFHHGKYSEAEQMLRRLIRQTDHRNDAENYHAKVSLATIFNKQTRHNEAERLYKQLLAEFADLSDRNYVALTRGLGRALRAQGKLAEAEDVARKASERVLVHGPADIRSQVALLTLGQAKLAQKAYEEAGTLFRQACDAIAAPYHQTHFECQMELASALRQLQSYDEAIVMYTRALDGCVRISGVDNELTRRCSKELDEVRAFQTRRGHDSKKSMDA